MAISDEIKEQTVKLKDMNRKQKAEYIWTYYKWWIIIALFVIIFISSTIKSVIRNSRPVYLNVMFLNSVASASIKPCTLESDFAAEYGIDTNVYDMAFDYVTYLDNNYGNQASMAGQVKLTSMYQAEELDIVCGPESTLTGSGDVGGYYKLDELLSKDKLNELEKKGYTPFYYTEKIYDDDAMPDAEGNIPYTDGETYLAGFCIDNCKMLMEQGDKGIYTKIEGDPIYLTVAFNAKNLEHAVEFIDFITKK